MGADLSQRYAHPTWTCNLQFRLKIWHSVSVTCKTVSICYRMQRTTGSLTFLRLRMQLPAPLWPSSLSTSTGPLAASSTTPWTQASCGIICRRLRVAMTCSTPTITGLQSCLILCCELACLILSTMHREKCAASCSAVPALHGYCEQ